MQRNWLTGSLVVTLVLIAGITIALRSGPPVEALPGETLASAAESLRERASSTPGLGDGSATAAPDVSFMSLDGKHKFGVPAPGDPEYEDYQEMLAHPRFRSFLDGTEGYALPYDPEWRSVLTGRREAPRIEGDLAAGASSLEGLAEAVLDALASEDERELQRLRVTKDEYTTMLWPEFPQSRPYLKTPVEEVWGFHRAKCLGGGRELLREFGGRRYELEAVEFGTAQEFTNFVKYDDVVLAVFDTTTQERRRINGVSSVVGRGSSYKVFIYRD
jgi:hypothetical protein